MSGAGGRLPVGVAQGRHASAGSHLVGSRYCRFGCVTLQAHTFLFEIPDDRSPRTDIAPIVSSTCVWDGGLVLGHAFHVGANGILFRLVSGTNGLADSLCVLCSGGSVHRFSHFSGVKGLKI